MIGEKVKERRIELGLTQEELAQKLGYKNRSSINKIELNKNDVSQKVLVRLAKALDVTPVYFLGDGTTISHETVPTTEGRDYRLMIYAKMMSGLSPSDLESVIKYIKFLSKENSTEGK